MKTCVYTGVNLRIHVAVRSEIRPGFGVVSIVDETIGKSKTIVSRVPTGVPLEDEIGSDGVVRGSVGQRQQSRKRFRERERERER
jgi:hypothetical protein